jgi:hypothetical protein
VPVNPQTCKPIYPYEYLEVNAIFEVAHDHGLRTAWSEKHPAYEALEGPAGNSIDELVHARDDSIALEPSGNHIPAKSAGRKTTLRGTHVLPGVDRH